MPNRLQGESKTTGELLAKRAKELEELSPQLRQRLNSLESTHKILLPLFRDHFDASIVIVYVFSRGPLEILQLGGSDRFRDELRAFHERAGMGWLKRCERLGPLLRDRCAMTEAEYSASPLDNLLGGITTKHGRGLTITARGRPLGLVALFRAGHQNPFQEGHDDLLIRYASPLADLFANLVFKRNQEGLIPLAALERLEEGFTVLDDEFRLIYSNEIGWSHLSKVCRDEDHQRMLSPLLIQHLRRVRDLDLEPKSWVKEQPVSSILLASKNGGLIRFRAHAEVGTDDRPFYSLVSSKTLEIPAASVDEVAKRMGLTRRERQVCVQLVEGKRNRAIAEAFGITEDTVKLHVRSVLGKLGVRSRSEVPGVVLQALAPGR